jgi:hypothetical protein
LLVPFDVTTVTLTVPGTVKFVVPFPAGTAATAPVSDHAEALGTTVAAMLPCVKTTLPGAVRKAVPLISMGRFTGLEALDELLIFKIAGTGAGGALLLPPPPQPEKRIPATTRITVSTAIIQVLLLISSSSWLVDLDRVLAIG